MNLLSYSRLLGERSASLLRSLGGTSRVATISGGISQRTEDAMSHEIDEPIDMKNPFEKERKICILCKHNIDPDYKNVRMLSQFQSRYTGRIYGRHITGLCKRKQDLVENEIIKAQNAGLMPYYYKEITYVHDPKLFDIENPFRPHKY